MCMRRRSACRTIELHECCIDIVASLALACSVDRWRHLSMRVHLSRSCLQVTLILAAMQTMRRGAPQSKSCVAAPTLADVKSAHSLLGRTAQVPWAMPAILKMHPYIDCGTIIVMPPAHNILRGPVRGLHSFALTTTAADLVAMGIDPHDHPVVFTPAQKREVQVRDIPFFSGNVHQ